MDVRFQGHVFMSACAALGARPNTTERPALMLEGDGACPGQSNRKFLSLPKQGLP